MLKNIIIIIIILINFCHLLQKYLKVNYNFKAYMTQLLKIFNRKVLLIHFPPLTPLKKYAKLFTYSKANQMHFYHIFQVQTPPVSGEYKN